MSTALRDEIAALMRRVARQDALLRRVVRVRELTN
jgi:hypothetical protein